MLDEALVEQVEPRSLLLSVTQNRFPPGETDGGVTVAAQDGEVGRDPGRPTVDEGAFAEAR